MLEKFRILIVDDDALVMELMKHAARRHDVLKIDSTLDSQEAIEKIRVGKPYHIILSDLVMPKYSGLDVLRAARMRSPDSRGIIVTGFGDKKSTVEAIKLGVSDYLHKPFRIEELDLAIRNAIEHFNLLRELTTIGDEADALKEKINNDDDRIAELEKQVIEFETTIGRNKARQQSMAANADKMAGAMRRPSISRTLTDLGDLHKAKQISDQEFHSMRKQIIDKAYKNII